MAKKLSVLLFALLIFLLSACTDKKIPASTTVSIPPETVSEKVTPVKSEFGLYLSHKIPMYSVDNKMVLVDSKEVFAYEKDGWFKEPVALVKKGKESKHILKSEMEAFRQDGFRISNFGYELAPLYNQLQDFIKNKSGRYGIYIKNLTSGEQLIINDEPYSAASIIKLFVMTGVYNEIASGNVIKTPTVSKALKNMITVSDNYSSNYLVRTMGKGNYKTGFNLENEMTKSMGCLNTQHLSLFIGYGDYVSFGRNFVSPVDCGIVLEKIYNKTLISEEYSEEMLGLLKNQQRRNKIPHLLPKDTVCANKTGETNTVQSDIGIVYSPNADYIICVLTNNAGSGIRDIQLISRMVYDYFN